MVKEEESLTAYGHPHVTATHRTTFEVTRDDTLSPAGNCILAVGSDKGAGDLNRSFCSVLRTPGARLCTTLSCGPYTVAIQSLGDSSLTLEHPTDLVWRRSAFTCPRTIGVYTDHTAQTIPREMVTLLQNGAELEILLTASVDEEE